MAFLPRSFEQILIDMINHVRANTTLTDFTVGSVIRTILEAAALEDDEQYFQMVKLLDAFRIATSAGTDLDERAADYNMQRLQAKESYGEVYFTNEGLTKSQLTFDVLSGAASLTVDDASAFPLTPPFFVIRVGEGTPQVEDVNVSIHTGASSTLTLVSVLSQNHYAGERVSVVAGSDISISQGLQVQTAATTTSASVKFMTSETGIIIMGNYQSGRVSIRASAPGKSGNVPAGRISQFVSSPPFTGAGVTGVDDTSGGRDLETDEEFRERLLRRFDELSRGTPRAVENSAVGVEDGNSGEQVVTAHLLENYVTREHSLYIDNGSGLTPHVVNMAATTLAAGATGGSTSNLQVVDAATFPASGKLILTSSTPANVEMVTYSAKIVGATNYLKLDAPVAHSHVIGDEVLLVEEVCAAAEDGQNYFHLLYWPIRSNTIKLFDSGSGLLAQRTQGTDYFLNRANGDLQYVSLGMPSGSKVYAHYSYSTGLMHEVQKVLNGDPDNATTYPGVVAAGIIVHVDTPVIRQVEIIVSLTVANGFDPIEVANEVQVSLQGYISSRRIGDNIVVAKIIEVVMQVSGVENVVVKSPLADVVILENELPLGHDNSGNSLVAVL
jgi:uncharacterized phage protein gp47/JayE